MRWRVLVKGTGRISRHGGWRAQARAHIRYCDRAGVREGNRFDAERNEVDRREFIERLAEDRGKTAAYKFIASFRSRREAPGDAREWTRRYMRALEEKWGVKLTWSTVQHRGEHPHLHVAISGTCEERGKKRALWLNREKLAEMKTIAQREFYRDKPGLWLADAIDGVDSTIRAWTRGPGRGTPGLDLAGSGGGKLEDVARTVKKLKSAAHPGWHVPVAAMESHLRRIGVNLDLGTKSLGQALGR